MHIAILDILNYNCNERMPCGGAFGCAVVRGGNLIKRSPAQTVGPWLPEATQKTGVL